MTNFNQALPSSTIKVLTPDGTMYVIITEDERGAPTRIDISIGKAGSRTLAWANALARLCTFLVKKGTTLHQIVNEIAGIKSDVTKMQGDTEIRSGPEGLAKAFLIYEDWKYKHGTS